MGVLSVLALATLPFVTAQTPVIQKHSIVFSGQYHPTTNAISVTLNKAPTANTTSFNVVTGSGIKASACKLTVRLLSGFMR
jgi:hypothetical protein